MLKEGDKAPAFSLEDQDGKGVKLALETLNRFETDMLNTVSQGIKFIRDVGRDNVGFHLDTFHMHLEEKSSPEAIRLAGDKLFHFHACENDRGVPGTGQVHWQEIAAALKSVNYQGPVVIESFTAKVKSIARAAEKVEQNIGRLDILINNAGIHIKPDSSGLNTTPPDTIRDTAKLAIEHGYQLCVHAIGDLGNRIILDLYEKILTAHGMVDADHRWRVIHAQVLHPDAAHLRRRRSRWWRRCPSR